MIAAHWACLWSLTIPIPLIGSLTPDSTTTQTATQYRYAKLAYYWYCCTAFISKYTQCHLHQSSAGNSAIRQDNLPERETHDSPRPHTASSILAYGPQICVFKAYRQSGFTSVPLSRMFVSRSPCQALFGGFNRNYVITARYTLCTASDKCLLRSPCGWLLLVWWFYLQAVSMGQMIDFPLLAFTAFLQLDWRQQAPPLCCSMRLKLWPPPWAACSSQNQFWWMNVQRCGHWCLAQPENL